MVEAVVLIASYLIGAVPVGLLIARWVGGVDLRTQGSGNVGMANAVRVSGWKAGAAVMAADMFKGVLAVLLARSLDLPPLAVAAAGLAAVVGHNWSIFLGFRGGKGVATSLGIAFVLGPKVALLLMVLWFAVVALTRYSSLASIIGLVAAPFAMWLGRQPQEAVVFCAATAVLGVVRHRVNIARLLRGEENKITGRSHPANPA